MNTLLAQSSRTDIPLPSFDETYAPALGSPSGSADLENTTAPDIQYTTATGSEDVFNWTMPFQNVWIDFFWFSFILSLIFLTGIIYSLIRIGQIRRQERIALSNEPPGLAMSMFLEGEEHAEAHGNASPQALQWGQVLEHSRSDNPNDWRLAIIEADVMLDALVTSKGYEGDGLGEKLKKIDKTQWNTIDQAWEAHKVRNRIAHEGQSAEIDEREVKRVINLYREVFEEFGLIARQ